MCWEGRVSHRPFWLQLCVPGQNQPRQHDVLRPQPLPIPDPGKVREERGPKLRDPSVLSPIQSPPASSPTPVLFSTLMIASQNHWPGLCWKIWSIRPAYLQKHTQTRSCPHSSPLLVLQPPQDTGPVARAPALHPSPRPQSPLVTSVSRATQREFGLDEKMLPLFSPARTIALKSDKGGQSPLLDPRPCLLISQAPSPLHSWPWCVWPCQCEHTKDQRGEGNLG